MWNSKWYLIGIECHNIVSMIMQFGAGSLSIAIDIVDKINERCKVMIYYYSQIDVEYILDNSNWSTDMWNRTFNIIAVIVYHG